MAALTYENLALQWSPEAKTDHVFNIIFAITMAAFIVTGVAMTIINLPEDKREQPVVIPENVKASLIETARPTPVPTPIPTPVPLPEHKPRPEEKPLTKEQKKAREDAFKKSGLQNLQKQLSDLMNTSSVDSAVKQKVTKSESSTQVASVNTNILTANAGTGSGGVSDSRYVATVGQTKLEGGQGAATALSSKAMATGAKATSSGSKGKSSGGHARTEEDITYVIDQHKSLLQSIYQRARRSNPGLKGKIVFEITIDPAGKVTKIVKKSSELRDAALEESIMARIRSFEFGPRPGGSLTVTVPVDFIP